MVDLAIKKYWQEDNGAWPNIVETLLATSNAKNKQVSLHHCHPANGSLSQTVLAEVIKNIKHASTSQKKWGFYLIR